MAVDEKDHPAEEKSENRERERLMGGCEEK